VVDAERRIPSDVKTMAKPILNVAIVLHMHQPRYDVTGGALSSETAMDVFRQTLHPYTFPPDIIKASDKAKVNFNFTGSLIEQINELAAVNFSPKLKGILKEYRSLKEAGKVELTGCGYFHPIFPLIPEAHRRRQIEMHLKTYEETFGGRPVGFWPPELAFSEDLIPLLDNMGFKWTIVDEPHVINANKDRKWHELVFHPHLLEHDGNQIAVVVRDRGISIAQQSGYDPNWLNKEVQSKLRRVPKNARENLLLVIATDGENGWFRHFGERAGFWGWFFKPLLEKLDSDPSFEFVKLTTIQEYLCDHTPEDVVKVESGSWNFEGWPNDGGFRKWTGGKPREERWKEIKLVSRRITETEEKVKRFGEGCPTKVKESLEEAWRWLLMAETSCNFYWGTEEWLDKARICCAKAMEQVKETERLCSRFLNPTAGRPKESIV